MPRTGLPCGLPIAAVNFVDVQIIVLELAAAQTNVVAEVVVDVVLLLHIEHPHTESIVAVCAGLALLVGAENHAALSIVGKTA